MGLVDSLNAQMLKYYNADMLKCLKRWNAEMLVFDIYWLKRTKTRNLLSAQISEGIAFEFGLASISGSYEHLQDTGLQTNCNQLLNIW